jgi:hypothetical protein
MMGWQLKGCMPGTKMAGLDEEQAILFPLHHYLRIWQHQKRIAIFEAKGLFLHLGVRLAATICHHSQIIPDEGFSELGMRFQ